MSPRDSQYTTQVKALNTLQAENQSHSSTAKNTRINRLLPSESIKSNNSRVYRKKCSSQILLSHHRNNKNQLKLFFSLQKSWCHISNPEHHTRIEIQFNGFRPLSPHPEFSRQAIPVIVSGKQEITHKQCCRK